MYLLLTQKWRFKLYFITFSEHDDTDYKSDEDPDYVAPIDVDNGISDDGSSADDESSDHEEMMQE